jgi:CRISPR system Cascade subunit CasB
MTGLIARLEQLNEGDTKVRAALRRSLAFEPGTYVPAFPYVEPFVGKDRSNRHREMLYLVAGLWAAHWKSGREGKRITVARACARYRSEAGSSSVELRFIALLDADEDQLPHRLRQIVALLKEYPLDFERLLNDLLYWHSASKHVQNRWAREFYQEPADTLDTESQEEEYV